MKVAVVSSMYGRYDEIAPQIEQNLDWASDAWSSDWVMVTDQLVAPGPWRVVTEPRPQLHPRLAAKVAKCRPDWYADADVYVWIDASIEITSPDFLAWCVDHVMNVESPIAQIPHPERTRITDEADVSAGMAKYHDLPVRQQVRHYLAEGYPDGWGLWATGLIVRRRVRDASQHAHRKLDAIGDAWLAEQMRWTYQDQLSEAPLLHRADIRPSDLDGYLWRHPKFRIRGHRDDT